MGPTCTAQEAVELLTTSTSLQSARNIWLCIREEICLYTQTEVRELIGVYETRLDTHIGQEVVTCVVCGGPNCLAESRCIYCYSQI